MSQSKIAMVRLHPILFSIMKKLKLIRGCKLPYQVTWDMPMPDQKMLSESDFMLVAAWPKSGSTYLSGLLSVLTGYPKGRFVQFYAHNEQELCEYRIIANLGKKRIIHQHVKGGYNNIALIKKYNIKPVILVRNIFDTLISLDDHFTREDIKWPGAYIHDEYMQFSFEEKMLFLVKIAAPWYFNFYISWIKAESKIDIMWMTYEELFSFDQCNCIKKIVSYLDIDIDDDKIKESIGSMKKCNTRLNVGKVGRGANLLPSSCKDEIVALAKSWKLPLEIFNRIGIE